MFSAKCKKEHATNYKNAIESITTNLVSKLADATNNIVAQDDTTWDEAAKEYHAAEAHGPPYRHSVWEVRCELTLTNYPRISHAR
jgi:hypothetical protein